MKTYDLSIVIPARHEEWLSQTVKDILEKKRGNTQVIAVLDGTWAEPQLEDHQDLVIIKLSKVHGQRGATNVGARLSRAKWIAKTDGHCCFDEGFDVKLLEAVKDHDDWTIVPAMKNLHAFNWMCDACGMEFYQGEKPEKCPSEMCQFSTYENKFSKKVYFVPRDMSPFMNNRGPTSTAYRFTPDNLQFKYFDALKKRQTEEISETMSLQGSFFMISRQRYWDLNICDESWGGWGQQGTEVALKSWLSGGRVVVHKGTWYAHMFRTNGQLAFPWNKELEESQGSQQRRARQASIELFKKNAWDKQVRPMSWLIKRFWNALQEEPSKTDGADRKWTQDDLRELERTEGRFEKEPTKGMLYFTDNQLNVRLAKRVQRQLKHLSKELNMELVSSTLKPMDMGKNIVNEGERGYLTMFKQILAGLEAMDSDIVYLVEHDVMYPKEHFTEFTPTEKDKVYYDQNWWKIYPNGSAFHWDADQVSGLCAYRELLLDFYRKRVAEFDPDNFDRRFEPLSRQNSESWKASVPHIDVRHGANLTKGKRSLNDFRDKSTAINFEESTIDKIPGWENLSELV